MFELLNDGGYLTNVSTRIVALEKEDFGSHNALKSQLEQDLAITEKQKEAAFKLQMNAASGTHAVQFYSEKIESPGSKKMELKKRLGALKESDTNFISLADTKKNLHDLSLLSTIQRPARKSGSNIAY
jgi:hypothetical protein